MTVTVRETPRQAEDARHQRYGPQGPGDTEFMPTEPSPAADGQPVRWALNLLHGAGLLDASMPSGGFTSWGDTPDFNYFGMQWVQVTGLPEGYVPTRDTITGLRVQADTPVAGDVVTIVKR